MRELHEFDYFLQKNSRDSDDVIESWAATENGSEDIMCYTFDNTPGGSKDKEYKLVIAGNGSGHIKANANSSYAFSFQAISTSLENDETPFQAFINLKEFADIDSVFDTSNVTNMSSMFAYAGYDVSSITLRLNYWNTLKVRDMSNMFSNVGYDATSYTLEVGEWNTSEVTNMNNMFENAFKNTTSINLDLRNWDISKVNQMSNMFNNMGSAATKENWIVRIPRLTPGNMIPNDKTHFYGSGSIYATPCASKEFSASVAPTLLASDSWFKSTQYPRKTFSEIEFLDYLYVPDGYDNFKLPDIILDPENFDAPAYATYQGHNIVERWPAAVADSNNSSDAIMCYVVDLRDGSVLTTGSPYLKLLIVGNGSGKIKANADSSFAFSDHTLSGDDTVSGCKHGGNTGFTNLIRLSDRNSIFDTTSATDMSSMFSHAAFSYTGDMDFNAMYDIENWDMSNVTNTNAMFNRSAYNASSVKLDLTKWDISKVTNMNSMFMYVGFNVNGKKTYSIDLRTWNPASVSDSNSMTNMFLHAGCSVSSSYWKVYIPSCGGRSTSTKFRPVNTAVTGADSAALHGQSTNHYLFTIIA